MKTSKIILISLVIGIIISSPCYGAEPFVIITSAYTTFDYGERSTEFEVWDAVVCHIDFSVFGSADKYYKIVGITKTLGETATFKTKVPPGDYSIANIHHVTDEYQPGYANMCQYKVKIKRGRDGIQLVKDTDTALSEISIVE